MLKQLIAFTGFFLLTAIPLAAQTATATPEQEKAHPLEANTPENIEYRNRSTPKYTRSNGATAAERKAKQREAERIAAGKKSPAPGVVLVIDSVALPTARPKQQR